MNHAEANRKRMQRLVASGVFSVLDSDTQAVLAPILAGGAVRSVINDEEIKDFDLFIWAGSPVEFDARKIQLVEWADKQEHWRNIFRCPEGLMFTYIARGIGKVQIITPRWYNSVADILDSFDFDICKGYYTPATGITVMPEILTAIKNRVVSLNKVSYPLATMRRMYKYKTHGYDIRPAEKAFLTTIQTETFEPNDMFRGYID